MKIIFTSRDLLNKATYRELNESFHLHLGISLNYLSSTKDIWCRDYMPVVRPDGKLLQFRYEPSYLKGAEHLQSIPAEVCAANDIQVDIVSNINLDGGNVLIHGNKALISDRIFFENSGMTKAQLLAALEEVLDVQVMLVPAMNPATDMTGHADGMIRWINDTTVLVGNLPVGPKEWQLRMTTFLENSGLQVEYLPAFWSSAYGPYNAVGCYINYLELDDKILLPVFNCPNNFDDQAVQKMKEVFPQKEIIPIPCLELAKNGGVLNCITWSKTNDKIL